MTNLVLLRPLLRVLPPAQFSAPPHFGRLLPLPFARDWGFDGTLLPWNAREFEGFSTVAGFSNCGKRRWLSSNRASSKPQLKRGFFAQGFYFITHNCNGERSSSNDAMQLGCTAAGDGLLTEAKCEDFKSWARGGGVVHPLAQVDETVIVEAGAVIHAHAQVGPNSHISSGSVVGAHVCIGSGTRLSFNVALQNCSVGDSCTLHNGVCVGQDGFGFTIDEKGEVVKKPQLLKVQIGNFVEIGANTCIDRGSWRDTVIGDHTKIDNLVQIGHNVVIGRCCLLCGQVGLGGSSTLGDYVVMGGKSGVSDHISVASKVRIAAKTAVISHITEPGDFAGFPAVPAREWRRSMISLRKLGRKPENEPV